jgi:hypothetical protein
MNMGICGPDLPTLVVRVWWWAEYFSLLLRALLLLRYASPQGGCWLGSSGPEEQIRGGSENRQFSRKTYPAPRHLQWRLPGSCWKATYVFS